MSVDFEQIPECVFELFDEIMWMTAVVPGRTCSDRGSAYILAWGWNPPLMEDGNEWLLTSYGLAANEWYRHRHKKRTTDGEGRDATWLRWSEEGMTPAKIRDKWNQENPKEKIAKGEGGRDVVKKAIARARARAKKISE